MTVAATGGYRLEIEIEGLASHAGGAPEHGISAIAIASLAIAQLVRDGWHGLIVKGDRRGTSNVGVIRGGEATNVVTDRVEIKAEARSHDQKFRREIVSAIEQAFHAAAAEVRNERGQHGKVRIHEPAGLRGFQTGRQRAVGRSRRARVAFARSRTDSARSATVGSTPTG